MILAMMTAAAAAATMVAAQAKSPIKVVQANFLGGARKHTRRPVSPGLRSGIKNLE